MKLYVSKSIFLSLLFIFERKKSYKCIYTVAFANHVDHHCGIYDWQRAHSRVHDDFLAESWIRNEMRSNIGIHGEIIREHAWHLPRAATMVQ